MRRELDADGMVWEPTAWGDNVIVALSGLNQLVILMTVVHLTWAANWPPYVVKNATLSCTTGVAGACWSIAIISSFGMYSRTEGTFWSQCDVEIIASWFSAGVLVNAAFLRVYRNWKRLQRHDRKMWKTEWQLLLMMAPFLLPSVFYLCRPELLYFDPITQECASEYATVSSIVGAYGMGLLILALYLMHDMRHLRHQYNEYSSVRRFAVAFILASVMFLSINAATGPEHGALRRRMEVMLSIFLTGVLFWTPMRRPVWAFIVKDEEYLDTYAHGFYGLPTPAKVRESLHKKMTNDELRREFRLYARVKIPPQLIGFYGLVLEHDIMEDFFERQALTMQIINGYVRKEAPFEVRITDACRKRVLESDVTKVDIFEEARVEVLKIMKDAFEHDLKMPTPNPSLRMFRDPAQERPPVVGSVVLREACPQGLPAPPPALSSGGGGSFCYSSDGLDTCSPHASNSPSPLQIYSSSHISAEDVNICTEV